MSNQYPPPPGYGSPQMNMPNQTPPGGKTSLGLDANVSGMLSYLSNILCCLGIIFNIVVLVTEKANRFARFHAIQSLLLSAAGIVVGMLLGVLTMILNLARIWVLTLAVGFGLRIIVGLIFLGLWILAGVKAYQGESYKLPVIGDMAENISGK